MNIDLFERDKLPDHIALYDSDAVAYQYNLWQYGCVISGRLNKLVDDRFILEAVKDFMKCYHSEAPDYLRIVYFHNALLELSIRYERIEVYVRDTEGIEFLYSTRLPIVDIRCIRQGFEKSSLLSGNIDEDDRMCLDEKVYCSWCNK